MSEHEKIQKNDCVEIKYTGYANNEVFDSNIEEDLKKLNSEAKAEKTIIITGQKMVVPGLDKSIEGKELDKDYEVNISPKEGFGERKRDLIKTIPLKMFLEQKLMPQAGMILTLNNTLVKVMAVSGARVIVDFNNPMAGKHLIYKFKIIRKVTDDKEKVEALFKFYLQFVPEIEVKDKIIVRGPKILEKLVESSAKKFKEFLNKEIVFEVKEEKKEKTHEHNPEHSEHEHSHEGHDHSHHDHEHSHEDHIHEHQD